MSRARGLDPTVFIEELPESERTELAITTRLTAVTEAEIRQHPDRRLWFHDRWRGVREGQSIPVPLDDEDPQLDSDPE